MMNACHIAHAPVDQRAAEQLAALLRSAGVAVRSVGASLRDDEPLGALVVLLSAAGVQAGAQQLEREVERAVDERARIAVVRTDDAPLPTHVAALIGTPAAMIDWRVDDRATDEFAATAIAALTATDSLGSLTRPTASHVGGATATSAPVAAAAGFISAPVGVSGGSGGSGERPADASSAARYAATSDSFVSDSGPVGSGSGAGRSGGMLSPAIETAVSAFNDGLDALRTTASIDAAPRPGLVGKIDRFEVLRVLGQGGMGVVLLARDPANGGALVAIKTIAPRYVGNARAQTRFVKEANNMRRMAHPNVLKVTECVSRPNGAYYVMPYVDAGSIARWIDDDQPADTAKLLDVAAQMADALRYAHDEAGVLHRDIKPENVLVDSAGKAYLSDFGLVRSMLVNETVPDSDSATSGWTVGTARYMAPEIADGKAGDTRADIYSFGAMLYELATGVAPYADTAPSATNDRILERILKSPPTPVLALNPALPPDLARLIDGAMGRELRDRYAHMKDVLEDLNRIRRGEPIHGPRGLDASASSGSPSVSGSTHAATSASASSALPPASPRSAHATMPGIVDAAQQPPPAPAHGGSPWALAAGVLGTLVILGSMLAVGIWMFGSGVVGLWKAQPVIVSGVGNGPIIATTPPRLVANPTPPTQSPTQPQTQPPTQPPIQTSTQLPVAIPVQATPEPIVRTPPIVIAQTPPPVPQPRPRIVETPPVKSTPQPSNEETAEQRAKRQMSEVSAAIVRGEQERAIETLRDVGSLKQADARAETGQPILNLAAKHGRLEVIRSLVRDHKFDVNRVDAFEHRTPLDCADTEAVRKVLRDEFQAKTAAEIERK